MKSFKEFIKERMSTPSAGTMFKIAHGATGPNADIRYKKTDDGWEVSKDKGRTWKAATPDHPSPMFNSQDIEAELEIGSIVKA